MNLLFQIILTSLVIHLNRTVAQQSNDHPFDQKRYKLNEKLAEAFSQDPEKNPFLKALESFPNKYTSQENIEEVLGCKFSKIKEQAKAAKEYAMLLVQEDMKRYEETLPFGNPQLLRVFKDFYDLMDLELNPDTLFLNKDSYVFFWEIPESQFISVYTMLSEFYEAYPPLESHVLKTEKAFTKVVHQIVLIKCPDYEHREPEKFSTGKTVEADAPVIEEAPVTEDVHYDEQRVKSIFETLHTPADPNYHFHINSASIYLSTLVGLLMSCLM